MYRTQEIEVVLRQRHQITLPADICEQLGVDTGDRLELWIEGDLLVARPKRSAARAALRELRATFAASGVSAAQLEEHARRLRQQARPKTRGQDT